eukprot:m.143006 g.143006  ORF g.143006 m.143006 type:complete len:63 (-) comp17682_c0_seq5:1146-1334(-)
MRGCANPVSFRQGTSRDESFIMNTEAPLGRGLRDAPVFANQGMLSTNKVVDVLEPLTGPPVC